MRFQFWREALPHVMEPSPAEERENQNLESSTDEQRQDEGWAEAGISSQTIASATVEDFDDIASILAQFKSRVELLEGRCEAFKTSVSNLKADLQQKQQRLDEANAERDTLRREVETSSVELQQSSDVVRQLQRAIAAKATARLSKGGPAQPFVQYLAAQREDQRRQLVNLQTKQTKLEAEKAGLTGHQTDFQDQLFAAQTDQAIFMDKVLDLAQQNEILRRHNAGPGLTDAAIERAKTAFPATPFVVVLIDGDAFNWSRDLFDVKRLGPHATPGGRAAQNLKTEIIKYMLAHEEQIPLASKIVVRITCNASSHLRGLSGANATASRQLEFMEKFTEAMPLFDYYHAGTGKERVDIKIHETIQLFLHNPLCMKMFLACSTDNGFARVLEQHIDDPGARKKLCLITAGFRAAEIARLGLEEMEMPTCFARRSAPAQTTAKNQRDQARQQREATQKQEAWDRGVSLYGDDKWKELVSGQALAQEIGHMLNASANGPLAILGTTRGGRASALVARQASREAATRVNDDHVCGEPSPCDASCVVEGVD